MTSFERSVARRRARLRRRRLRLFVICLAVGTAIYLLIPASGEQAESSSHAREVLREDITNAAAISPLRGRIVAIAESQIGYVTDPRSTYCNKYSAYWYSGADDCGNTNL